MNFDEELSRGRFCIPQCEKCGRTVWPPSEFCSRCMGSVFLKKGDFEGKIIEFSKHGKDYFCVVEFEGAVRIIAKADKAPDVGAPVRISRCGIVDGDYFFHVS